MPSTLSLILFQDNDYSREMIQLNIYKFYLDPEIDAIFFSWVKFNHNMFVSIFMISAGKAPDISARGLLNKICLLYTSDAADDWLVV